MIDTISLTIKQEDFRIMDHNKFSPSTENLFVPPYIKITARAPFKAVYNPTKADIDKYGYLPRLTVYKVVREGGFPIFLKVEFSIPKLLYSNNFDEVEESDFGEICWKLKQALYNMKVQVNDIKILSNGDVSTVHYSKNIILTDYSTPYSILKEVSKANINKLLDVNQTDFRNGGHAFKYHSNDFEVIFYDKLSDLKQAKKSEKRTIEKDNYIQLGLFDKLKTKEAFEVLRIEVRLGSRRKIKQRLNKYSIEGKELIFNDLFSKQISQALLVSTVKEIEAARPKILKTDATSNEDLLDQLQLNNPQISYRKLLTYTGLKNSIDEMGTRKFREATGKFGDTCWYRLQKEMKGLNINVTKDPFDTINKVLEEFDKIELVKYKNKL